MSKWVVAILAVGAMFVIAYWQNFAKDKEQLMERKHAVAASVAPVDPDAPGVDLEKVDWSQVDWRKRLSRDEFEVMRRAGTERAFTGEYWNFFENGAYKCRGCGLPLFESDAKFDSHCGWPSFDKTLTKDAVVELEDNSHFMHRTEVRCRRCGAHLGHVFDDGPTETGLRYCMNSASIRFVPAENEKQEPPAKQPAKP
jgi:peptide-methionine (R)-S-oxide reductase